MKREKQSKQSVGNPHRTRRSQARRDAFRPILRIRERRLQKKMTQQELGKKVGMGPEHICQYERSVRTPGWGTMALLAKALGCATVGDLIDCDQTFKVAKGGK